MLTTCSFLINAQTDLYIKIRQLIHDTQPEIILDNKLIAFNSWSSDDTESREANKSFEKVYKIYEYARLKGGLKGVVVITVNHDPLSSMAAIALKKDGIVKVISLNAADIKDLPVPPGKNIVFDADGKEVYRDLEPSVIFASFNQLITR